MAVPKTERSGNERVNRRDRSRGPESRQTLTRHAVASLLTAHARTIAKWLPKGLGSAIVEFGDGGEPMMFDLARVRRWYAAFRCPVLARGGYCHRCSLVLEDSQAVSEHVLRVRHKVGGCENCGHRGGLGCMPCGASEQSQTDLMESV